MHIHDVIDAYVFLPSLEAISLKKEVTDPCYSTTIHCSSQKTVCKMVKDWTSGQTLPLKNFGEYHTPLSGG